ncbi:DUF2793 domain-containing protein [Rhizobium sp. S153]|uniref:DUF2793 domain-containing protein n=1 Tax=Ciceribacter sichuanensis TaxID=2949647 RepID=A0ABT0V976_9HYPH|nr:DUF2793 domain-containing protein [Ciceribacter sp. S153]MCM2400978.1 DUF2793 domain-containing protein [Ciceribacter sp. S153]
MSDITSNLALPYILPAQAQKHVTHNEALQRLDAIVQLTIAGSLHEPPAEAEEGDCYWVLSPASGAFSGKSERLAFRQDDAWIFITPKTGWRAFDLTENSIKVFAATAWHDISMPSETEVSTLGISTSADTTNRLSLSSPASLFNHAGGDHRMKINKAATGDTASLLFQSGWQGKAEMGLAGDDGFSIKVSDDGADWKTALAVSPDGIVRMSHRPLARAARTPATLTIADGTVTGFHDLHASAGGFLLGAPLASGHGSGLVVPITGLYLFALGVTVLSATSHTVSLRQNDTTTLAVTTGPAGSRSAVAIASLSAGDILTLRHTGSAELQFGLTATEISILML